MGQGPARHFTQHGDSYSLVVLFAVPGGDSFGPADRAVEMSAAWDARVLRYSVERSLVLHQGPFGVLYAYLPDRIGDRHDGASVFSVQSAGRALGLERGIGLSSRVSHTAGL